MADIDPVLSGTRGSIITFYSYKGGVGRSMAVANVALLLARAGKSVLCVDWDLEAPGLDRFFENLKPTSAPKSGGLLAVLENSTPDRLAPWLEYVCTTNIMPTLHFLSSGHDAQDYSKRVGDFSWSEFFENRGGGEVIECLRDEWREKYDFVLVDSRTGLTDSSGICTIQLPDILVILFAANHQNVEGCKRVAQGVRNGRRNLPYDRQFLPIVPVLSRFDPKEESDRAAHWMDLVATSFGVYFRDWIPRGLEPRQMVEWIRLPYVPRYSFGEDLAVEEQGTSDPQLLGFYYNILARLLLTRFADVRAILVAAGVPGADLQPLLPNDTDIRAELHKDPNYARRRAEEIAKLGDEYPTSVLAALERLSAHSADFQRLNDADDILRRAVQLVRNPEMDLSKETARILGSHAALLAVMGRKNEAEVRHLEALRSVKTQFGDPAEQMVLPLMNYASFLAKFDRLNEAEIQLKQAITIADKFFGDDPSRLAVPLASYAELLAKTDRKREAVDVLQRIWRLYRAVPAPDDTAVDSLLHRIRELFLELEHYQDALAPALEAVERFQVRPHQDRGGLSEALDRCAWVYELLGRYTDSIPLYQQCLELKESDRENEKVSVASACTSLASPLSALGRYEEAELLYRRALTLNEETLGAEHPNTATACAHLADLLAKTGRFDDAEALMRRALAICEGAFGQNHQRTGHLHSQLGLLLSEAGRYVEAEVHHQLALAIDEKIYGNDHHEVAFDRVSLARALSEQNKTDDAELLWKDSLLILKKTLGSEHEQYARILHHYAQHLGRLGRIEEAQAEIKNVLKVLERVLGPGHPDTVQARLTEDKLKSQSNVAALVTDHIPPSN